MVNDIVASAEEGRLLGELWYILMYVISDIVRVRAKGERFPGSSLIAVNIEPVFLDTFPSSKAIAFFPCCTRVGDLEFLLKPQTIFPSAPDIVLPNGSHRMTRGRTRYYRGIIILDWVNAETITIAVAYGVILA